MSDRPSRIIIVDDDSGDAEIMELMLKEVGFSFTMEVCEDGEKASHRFFDPAPDSLRPDLVLLDLNLPGKNGREVLSELKTNSKTRDIPVIILTTSATPEEIKTFETFTNTRCRIKPYVLNEYGPIVDLIRDTLAGGKGA